MKKTITNLLFALGAIVVLTGAILKLNYNQWANNLLFIGFLMGMAAVLLFGYYQSKRIKELEEENQELKEQIKNQ